MTITATDANFSDLINDGPVLVDFWAEWCGPCHAMTEPLEDLSETMKVAKLNIDDHPDIAAAYSVMSIPTMVVFDKSEEQERFVGARSGDMLREELKSYL